MFKKLPKDDYRNLSYFQLMKRIKKMKPFAGKQLLNLYINYKFDRVLEALTFTIADSEKEKFVKKFPSELQKNDGNVEARAIEDYMQNEELGFYPPLIVTSSSALVADNEKIDGSFITEEFLDKVHKALLIKIKN
jgi:hypothetical protein